MQKMEHTERLNSHKLLTALCISLIVYNLFITAVVGWLVVKTDRHEQELAKLGKASLGVPSVKSSSDVSVLREESSDDKSAVHKLERREVLTSGTVDLADLLRQGIRGPPGSPGHPGKDGRDGRDAVNFESVNHRINVTVAQAVGLEMGRIQTAMKQIPTVSGAVYIRWGKTSCPSTARLITKGVASGTNWSYRGGGSQYLCLPDDPEYDPKAVTPARISRISGVEYEYPVDALFGRSLYQHNAPCSYCQAIRAQKLTIPGKMKCPSEWKLEYQGYLMTEPTNHEHRNRNSFVCVDKDAEPVPGQSHNTNGAIWNHVVAYCTSGEGALGYCPPYKSDIPISCVVCSK